MADTRSAGRLQGRVALISGGVQGIGRASAGAFQREGASIVPLDCDSGSAARAVQELGAQARNSCVQFVEVDLSNAEQISCAMRSLKTKHERISVFKKYVKWTPREFASQPHHWIPLERLGFGTGANSRQ